MLRFAYIEAEEIKQMTLPEEGSGPVNLVEDADTGDRFLVYSNDSGVQVELRVLGDSFWATQSQMAEMFGVNVPAISKHLKNIFEEGELEVNATVSKMERVAIESGRRVTRQIEFYNLNAVISVGYRVGSKQGTMFRVWATDKLMQYLTKGFVIDDERLKNPDGRPDYFEELLERIRDIRASEKRMWTRVLELAPLCSDYDPIDQYQPAEFFAEIQNTMHWAVLGMTAPEVVRGRVDAGKEHAGLTSFKGKMPTVQEAQIAKNLLHEPEIKALNHITSLVLEFFESQAEQRRLTTLPEFLAKMRELVKLDGRPVKKAGYAGKVSRPIADKWASAQLRDYKARKRLEAEESGAAALTQIAASVRERTKKRPKKAAPSDDGDA